MSRVGNVFAVGAMLEAVASTEAAAHPGTDSSGGLDLLPATPGFPSRLVSE